MHFVLFVLRVLLLVRANRTTRFVTYEAGALSETLTSVSIALGPFAFDFRFSLRRSGADLPAGTMVREDQAGRAVGGSNPARSEAAAGAREVVPAEV